MKKLILIACCFLAMSVAAFEDISKRVAKIQARNGHDHFTANPVAGRVVTGPASLYIDWNDSDIFLNHPIRDAPIKAPQLADEFFEELKITLTIKADLADAQELLLFILSNNRLGQVTVEVEK